MNWGFASYETRFRWVAAIWAVILTGWCFADTNWKVRVVGALLWVIITVVLSLRFAWWRPRSEREVPIFLLLGRRSEAGADVACPSLADLEVLIRNLLAAGYRFQTVTEAIVAPARKSVAMTFDGGARETLGSLLPLLQRYNVKATLFVTKVFVQGMSWILPFIRLEQSPAGNISMWLSLLNPASTMAGKLRL